MGLTEVDSWTRTVQDAVARIRSACADADGHDPLDEAADLRLRHRGLEDSRLWVVQDSGFALLHGGGLDLAVAPSVRGCGFGGQLAAAAAPYTTTAWSHGDHPAAAHLAARHGFQRARELWVMRRPSSTPVPEVPVEVPIRAFRPGDEPEIVRVNGAAFAHHPEQASMDLRNLAERMAEPWFDPEGLFVAEDDGRVVGFHWTKRHPNRRGEVYVVAVAPDAQGRGLGPALLRAGLLHLADTAEVLLYVESDNLPARRMYERLGFTHAPSDTHVQYHRA